MANVYNIGEFRMKVESGYSWNEKHCQHRHVTMKDTGEVVECDDCHKQISAYWLLKEYFSNYDQEWNKLVAFSERLKTEREHQLHLTAAIKVEKAWRSRSMVPCCPHCGVAIFPEDGLGDSMVDKQIAHTWREKRKQFKAQSSHSEKS